MKAHLTDNDIDIYVSGMMNRREKLRTEKHLYECTSCRKKVSILSGVLSERKYNSVPGDHVKAAVLAEWHRMNTGVIARHNNPRFSLRLAYGFAAAVIIAVSAYFAVNRMSHNVYAEGLLVTSVAGEVQLNNRKTVIDLVMHNGDLLSTGTGSAASLAADKYKLEIESSSEIKLADSEGDSGYHFILNRGSVTSRSEGKLDYSFTCRAYRIAPAGTEFRIEMSESNITVAVWSGRVIVSGADLIIDVPAGMIWDSENPGKVRSADAGDTNDKTTDTASRTSASGEFNGNDTVRDSGAEIKGDNKPDPDEIRDLKRESRDEIRDMKKDNRKERQYRGGN